ncbi:LysR family transcriptional regulator [Micromonospora sp. NPDC005171]|uniref:LysR family transcriptional regulator n=1 Tax=Micromonospora sp. NPDC005171 TaxID=3156866 RepID=UPI0033B6F333
MEIDQLRALRAVGISGSISAAAQTLHVTTSAISQRLTKLEREVGQPLLDRYGRNARLTNAGSLLVTHAEQILSQLTRAEAELKALHGLVTGTVRVSAFSSAARGLLPETLRRLHAAHPQLGVRVSEMEPDDALPLVLRGDLDVAVLQDWFNVPLQLPDTVCKVDLINDVVDLALPAGHPLAGRPVLELDELHDEQWVSWSRGSVCHDWFLHTLRERGCEPEIVHTAGEYQTQLALVAAGFGVALVPRVGLGAVPDGVQLVPVRPAPSRRVYAVWQVANVGHPAISVTVDVLREVAAQLTAKKGDPVGRSAG